MSTNKRPHIVGIGGTTKPGSSTEQALVAALNACEELGASVTRIGGAHLGALPLYMPEVTVRNEAQLEYLEAVRRADGIIIATPAYHAGISGLIKNAIDLLEDLRSDPRPYIDNLAVGCIVCAYGWQGGGATLTSLRTVIHALRGWPTPLGITLNSSLPTFDQNGALIDGKLDQQFKLLARQVVSFATAFQSP